MWPSRLLQQFALRRKWPARRLHRACNHIIIKCLNSRVNATHKCVQYTKPTISTNEYHRWRYSSHSPGSNSRIVANYCVSMRVFVQCNCIAELLVFIIIFKWPDNNWKHKTWFNCFFFSSKTSRYIYFIFLLFFFDALLLNTSIHESGETDALFWHTKWTADATK